jgi:hypothetical protein
VQYCSCSGKGHADAAQKTPVSDHAGDHTDTDPNASSDDEMEVTAPDQYKVMVMPPAAAAAEQVRIT